MKQYGRRYKQEPAHPMMEDSDGGYVTREERMLSALERIADMLERLLEMAEREREGRR